MEVLLLDLKENPIQTEDLILRLNDYMNELNSSSQ